MNNEDLKQRAQIILERLDLGEKKKKITIIEAESMKQDFWKDNVTAAQKMQELATLQKEVEDAKQLHKLLEEGQTDKLEKLILSLEKVLYLSGKYDHENAIFSIHAGQGGADAMDFASILFRMYSKYFEKQGFKHEIINYSAGEEAGIKNVTITVSGKDVYGYLKGEQGVHRLVRLSPFNSDQLRHTSFALVEVTPDIHDNEEVEIKEDDLNWDFFRASGHGGQNVQKVSSAVRLTHKPSGIVVTCQNERYQAQNREYALKLLKAKLWAKKMEEQKEKEQEMKGEYQPASWGNQIRSYVLHPYQMVKDLRTEIQTSNVDKVLDGHIDEFVEARLKQT